MRDEFDFIDFMGNAQTTPNWVDRVTWEHLFQKLKIESSSPRMLATSEQNQFIAISGMIDTANTVTLNPFIVLSDPLQVSQSLEGGAYAIEFVDNQEMVLSTHQFDVRFLISEVGEVSRVSFHSILLLPENTSKMVMTRNGTQIASRTFSINPPEIELVSPLPGETTSEITTIAWQASDPDGDELSYDILYSPDGQEQVVVAVNIKDSFYEWNNTRFTNSTSGAITVVATDGINEAKATVENLVVSVDGVGEAIVPTHYLLHQNYPNPFNPETRIQYDLPRSTHVRIEIFNILGQKITTLVDEQKLAGSYSALWNGRFSNGEAAASGVYIYRLRTKEIVKSKKLLLLR